MVRIVRDLVIVVGVSVICGLLLLNRVENERNRAARLAKTEQAIRQLEGVYKTAVFDASENKGDLPPNLPAERNCYRVSKAAAGEGSPGPQADRSGTLPGAPVPRL